MKYYSHLNTAVNLLTQYKGEQPFAAFIKDFFRKNKKYGSADRKQISHLCYCYFRLGKSMPALGTEEKILAGLFLCSATPNDLLQQLRPDWNDKIDRPIAEKCTLLSPVVEPGAVFPWIEELSTGIDAEAFGYSFFTQPELFLRVRPGYETSVPAKLDQAGAPYRMLSSSCIALPATYKADAVLEINREVVIQDKSSQQTGDLLPSPPAGQSWEVWDCCAGSGGKSIMAVDRLPGIRLTVSDKRASILANLQKRFAEAGIKKYKSFSTDLTRLPGQLPAVDLLIADVPCTGSGTWGRSPEQLFYFTKEKIADYAALQRQIIASAIPPLKPGGYLLYITCSVFKKENEEAVDFIQEQYALSLLKMELIKGYTEKADTLFAALLQKPL